MMAHYRSTVDFSSAALEAAEKGLTRLQETYSRLSKLQPAAKSTVDISGLRERCEQAMSDDLNSPIVISELYDSARIVNTLADGNASISAEDLAELKDVWKVFAQDILGLQLSSSAADNSNESAYHGAVDMLLDMRLDAKKRKDWTTSDLIRNKLTELGFVIKDTKDGYEWSL